MPALSRILQAAASRADIVFACFFVVIVAMLVLPLPPALIDVLLAFNLALSLTILLASTYLRNTLDLSTFPTILLITTVFRLALTVSTARMILAHGDAGHIIRGFGQFVVAGNVVVGLVVFLIVAIVQFLVVTKGAERVAEVGARFTLDALPGKQLSIDSDFRNGEITKEEARRRRLALEKESQFFGAMDGAMRFVKGDAIASLLIVTVNLIGGIAIGTLQRGLPLGEAAKLYSLLSIGDGLVTQIPSMFLAVAAGTVVTRVVTEENGSLGGDISRQLTAEPKALMITGVFVGALAVVPGFPAVTLLTLGLLLCGGAWLSRHSRTPDEADAPTQPPAELPAAVAAPTAPVAAPVPQLQLAGLSDVVTVRLAPELVQKLQAAGLAQALDASCTALSHSLGFGVRPPGFVQDGRFPGAVVEVDGVPVRQIPPDQLAPAEAVASQIAEVQARFASRLFGTADAARWLEEAQGPLGVLVADVQEKMPRQRIVEILRRLLEETVPLSQRRVILEALLQSAGETDPDLAADQVRIHLRRQICHTVVEADGTIPALIAGADVEDLFRGATEAGTASAALVAQIRRVAQEAKRRPVVITAGDVRRRLGRFLRTQGFDVAVLSYDELVPEFQTRPIGALSARLVEAA